MEAGSRAVRAHARSLATYHYKTACRKNGNALQAYGEADTNLELKTYRRHITGEGEVDGVTQCRESVTRGMWQISSLSEMLFSSNRRVKRAEHTDRPIWTRPP